MENIIAIVIAPLAAIGGVWLTRIYDLKKFKMELEEKEQSRDFEISRVILPDVLNSTKNVYCFIMELNHLANFQNEESKETVYGKLRDMRKWHDENIIFLSGNVRQEFLALINLSPMQNGGSSAEFWTRLIGAIEKIQDGIDQFIDRYSLLKMNQ